MVLARNVSLFFGRGHQKTAVSISGPQLAYGSCQECGPFFGTVGGRESEEVLVILEVLHERGSISEELMEPAPVFLLCNCTVQYSTVYNIVQYSTVRISGPQLAYGSCQECGLFFGRKARVGGSSGTVEYSTVQYSAVLHCTLYPFICPSYAPPLTPPPPSQSSVLYYTIYDYDLGAFECCGQGDMNLNPLQCSLMLRSTIQ